MTKSREKRMNCDNDKITKFRNIIDYWSKSEKARLFIMNFAFLVFFLGIGTSFDTSDDVGLRIVYDGTYGKPSAYSLHTSTILGMFISGLYRIFPKANWYVWLTIITIFVSLCIISYVIYKRTYRYSSYILIPFEIVAGQELYSNIQFTKTAGVACVAGLSLLIYELINYGEGENCRKINRNIILSNVLILLGSMIRIEAFFIVIVFFSLLGTWYIVKDIIDKKYKSARTIVINGLFSILLVSTFFALHEFSFKINREEDEYKQWYTAVSNCVDFDLPEYWEAEGEYENLGLSANDFYMLKGWYFGDPDFFTIDLLKDIRSVKRDDENTWDKVSGIIKSMPDILLERFNEWFFKLFIYVLVLYLVVSRKNASDYIMIIVDVAAVAFALFGFAYVNRMMVRVNAVMWLSAIMIVVFLFFTEDMIDEQRLLIEGMIITVLLVSFNSSQYISNYHKVQQGVAKREDNKILANYIIKDKGTLYINDWNNIVEKTCGGVFDIFDRDVDFDNVVGSYGWLCDSPLWHQNMNSKGVKNIYRDTMDKNVIYISTDKRMPSIINFINDHYNPNAKVKKIMELNDDRTFYKIVSGDLSEHLNVAEYNEISEMSQVSYLVNVDTTDGRLNVSGSAYVKDTDSYFQKVYIILKDRKSENYKCFAAVKKELEDIKEPNCGRYGGFYIDIKEDEIGFENYEMDIVLTDGNNLYSIPYDLNENQVVDLE